MSVSRHATRRPARSQLAHRVCEQARVLERLHEGAVPTFTSSTIASAPAAIFFDMMLAAISCTLSTVPVTSRSA